MALGDYLTIKSSLEDMNIGDAIPCRYQASSGAVGTFSELGTCTMAEIPVGGSATPNGLFYFIKVDKGLLIADRPIQHSISWNTLNTGGFIEGKRIQQQSLSLMVRSMTGGVAYADNEDKSAFSLVDKGFGAFPNNEWDKYTVNSDLDGKITPGDNNIWHWASARSWCKETAVDGMKRFDTYTGDPTMRINRSRNSSVCDLSTPYFSGSAYAGTELGFRPVLQYIEPDGSTKQKTLWY